MKDFRSGAYILRTPSSTGRYRINIGGRFLATKRIRRGVFKSVTDLKVAIHSYLAEHNDHPKPFVWTAKASDILAKVGRGKQALESEH
jgi:hypothetical protein